MEQGLNYYLAGGCSHLSLRITDNYNLGDERRESCLYR